MAEEIVVVELVARVDKLEASLKKADKRVSKTMEGLKRLAGVLLAAFSVRAIARWASDTARWANELDKVAREMNLTMRGAQQLAFFSEATGISMSNIRDAAFEIKKRFGEIGENERFRNTMKALHISKEQAAGLNNAQLMFTTLEAISRLPLDEQEIALDQAFGGGAAKELNQLVKDREFFLKTLETAGGVRGVEGGAKGFKQLQLQTALVKANFRAVSAELLVKVLPTVIKIFDWVLKNGDEIVGWGVAVKDFVSRFDPAIKLVRTMAEFSAMVFIHWDKIKATLMEVADVFISIWTTIKDIWNLVSSPLDTASAVGKGIFNSIKSALGVGEERTPLTSRQGLPAPTPAPFFAGGQGPMRDGGVTQNFLLHGPTSAQVEAKARREAAGTKRKEQRG